VRKPCQNRAARERVACRFFLAPPGIGGADEPRNEASRVVPKNASAARLLIFSRSAPYLKTKDALSRDFKRMLAALAFFSTTPLASFLGSLAPPIPGGA